MTWMVFYDSKYQNKLFIYKQIYGIYIMIYYFILITTF